MARPLREAAADGKELSSATGPTYYANAIPTSVWSNLDYVNNHGLRLLQLRRTELAVLLRPGPAQRLPQPRLPQEQGHPRPAVLRLQRHVSETIQKTKSPWPAPAAWMIWEISGSNAAAMLQAITDTLDGKH
jgi:hypothetical protein